MAYLFYLDTVLQTVTVYFCVIIVSYLCYGFAFYFCLRVIANKLVCKNYDNALKLVKASIVDAFSSLHVSCLMSVYRLMLIIMMMLMIVNLHLASLSL